MGEGTSEFLAQSRWVQQEAEEAAKELFKAKEFEQRLLARLRAQYPEADENVLREMAALRARGEDLSRLDEAYFERAFRPALSRLMDAYRDAIRANEEAMAARGIASTGRFSPLSGAEQGAISAPEEFEKSLIGREYANAFSRAMLEAQNQAMQQKLQQYNARLAEMQQANIRRGQIFDPMYAADVVPEVERQRLIKDYALGQTGQRLGYVSSRAQSKAAKRGQDMALAGAILSGIANVGAAMASKGKAGSKDGDGGGGGGGGD